MSSEICASADTPDELAASSSDSIVRDEVEGVTEIESMCMNCHDNVC